MQKKAASIPNETFHITRRAFLRAAIAATASTGVPAWLVEETLAQTATPVPLSANDKPGVALIGCGGRGTAVAKDAAKFGNIVALCDADSSHLENASKLWPSAKKYKDFRKAMEQPDVQLVITGT